jgi:L-rhamnose mutarotase
LRRFAQVIKLPAHDEEEYIRHHAAAFAGCVQTTTGCEIRNYSVFLRSGVLSAYFEYHGSDYDADMRKMGADEATHLMVENHGFDADSGDRNRRA